MRCSADGRSSLYTLLVINQCPLTPEFSSHMAFQLTLACRLSVTPTHAHEHHEHVDLICRCRQGRVCNNTDLQRDLLSKLLGFDAWKGSFKLGKNIKSHRLIYSVSPFFPHHTCYHQLHLSHFYTCLIFQSARNNSYEQIYFNTHHTIFLQISLTFYLILSLSLLEE